VFNVILVVCLLSPSQKKTGRVSVSLLVSVVLFTLLGRATNCRASVQAGPTIGV